MKYSRKLTGERIYLSPMNVDDAETYARWLSDPAVTDGLGSTAKLIGSVGERKWIESNQSDYQLAIIRKEDDKLLGNCGINEYNPMRRTAEVGLFIGDAENRGKGYGTETLKLLVKFCFDQLNLVNVMLKVFSFNEQAIACYEKVGFKKIGVRRKAYFINGEYCDEVYMDILKDEQR